MIVLLLGGMLAPGITSANDNNSITPVISNDNEHSNAIDLYLDVTLNGNHIGIEHFSELAGKLYSNKETLQKIGFKLPDESAQSIRLDSLSQLQFDYNVSSQTLKLTVPLSTLNLNTTKLNQVDIPPPVVSTSRGMLLNYDVYAAQGDGSNVSSFTELCAFNSAGVLSSTQLTQYSTQTDGVTADNNFSRLDTQWRSSFPDRLLSLTLGDTLTSSLTWSRPTRIAGIQIGTDFNLQPNMPTTPLPSFLGSATVPSNVELFINGMKYYNGEVPAGNFEINTQPNISGAGYAQVNMTDALGRTTTQSFSFYQDQQLLREGLTQWSAELGVVRENYGISSFDYASTPSFSGTWRRGISNSFTGGVHSEVSKQLLNSGFSMDWIPGGRVGTLSTSLAMSTDAGDNGMLYSLGYRWIGSNFNFSTSTIATAGDYRDIASRYGSAPPSLNSNVVVGYNMPSYGNVSLSYLQYRYPQETSVRYAGANWYAAVANNIYLTAGVNQNVDDSRDRNLYLTATFILSNNLSASSTVQRTNDENGYMLNASRTQPSDGGWGWNLAASQQSSQQNGQGELGYLGRYGKVYSGFNRTSDTQYAYAGGSGALVMMGGGLFAARTIDDGFAVVSTDGIPDLPIKLQNNLIGTSNSQGLLLVTPIKSYENNLLSIDPMNLPANTRIDQVNAYATPADRSGSLVKFGITPVRAAQIIVVDAQGKPIEEGTQVELNAKQNQQTIVGFDGLVYFDTLELHNTLKVMAAKGTCSVQFDYPQKAASIAQLGPLVCR
ncbi:outer membrane usher protein [Buttiauxella sp. BIGb0552]|nr:outer membrane usher protein [Buttiauxella sp. BIGb0552]